MKNLLRFFLFIYAIIFLSSIQINAQNDSSTFIMMITNDSNPPTGWYYIFDVYMLSTGPVPVELSTLSLGFSIKTISTNGGNITAAWEEGFSELTNTSQIPIKFNTSQIGPLTYIKITGNAPPGPGKGSLISNQAPGTRIGKIIIMNTNLFYTPAADIKWEFGSCPTILNAYVDSVSTDITSSGIFNYLHSQYLWITAPNNNEIWQTNSIHTISWTYYFDDYLKIELTNGSNWITLVDSIKNSGAYTFIVPPITEYSNNCYIKITSLTYGNVCTNNLPFTITSVPTPNITVTSPNTAVKWKIGTDQNITWNYTGNISKVKIEFSSDGHNTHEPIINSTDASALSYTWHIPSSPIDYPTAFYSIKISDVNNPKVYDESDVFFTISTTAQNTLSIISPNGGESWKAGTLQPIKWENSGVTGINAYFSSNGGVSWSPIISYISATNGNYLWTLPNISSNNCLVKLEDASDPTLFSISEKPFNIYPSTYPTYTMTLTNDNFLSSDEYQFDIYLRRTGTKPFELSSAQIALTYNNAIINGGTLTASFVPGSIDTALVKSGQQNVNFNTDTPGVIKIEGQIPLGGSGTGAVISDVAPGIRIGRLKLVNSVPFIKQPFDLSWCFSSTSEYQTKISAFVPAFSSGVSTDITDSTQHFITLTGNVGPITLISPLGGDYWKAGTFKVIKWLSVGIINMNIYFSSNGGANWNFIGFGPADSSYYFWVTPNITSTDCRIKLEDASDKNTNAISNSPFTVWQPIQSVQTPGMGQITQNFGATNIDLAANVKSVAPITVVYSYLEAPKTGVLPDNVVSIGNYYWDITSPSISFIEGKISTPISKLSGVIDSSKLVWLRRINPGDAWINIGANIIGGNLVSSIDFAACYEFAIGTDTSHILNVRDGVNIIPKEYSLLQNYPNPFNPGTTIKYSLPNNTHVKLCIYNSLGQEIAVLISQDMNAGVYTSVWNASKFASGVYFYRIIAGNFVQTKKLILLK